VEAAAAERAAWSAALAAEAVEAAAAERAAWSAALAAETSAAWAAEREAQRTDIIRTFGAQS
jgi:hypothetical protein